LPFFQSPPLADVQLTPEELPFPLFFPKTPLDFSPFSLRIPGPAETSFKILVISPSFSCEPLRAPFFFLPSSWSMMGKESFSLRKDLPIPFSRPGPPACPPPGLFSRLPLSTSSLCNSVFRSSLNSPYAFPSGFCPSRKYARA